MDYLRLISRTGVQIHRTQRVQKLVGEQLCFSDLYKLSVKIADTHRSRAFTFPTLNSLEENARKTCLHFVKNVILWGIQIGKPFWN